MLKIFLVLVMPFLSGCPLTGAQLRQCRVTRKVLDLRRTVRRKMLLGVIMFHTLKCKFSFARSWAMYSRWYYLVLEQEAVSLDLRMQSMCCGSVYWYIDTDIESLH